MVGNDGSSRRIANRSEKVRKVDLINFQTDGRRKLKTDRGPPVITRRLAGRIDTVNRVDLFINFRRRKSKHDELKTEFSRQESRQLQSCFYSVCVCACVCARTFRPV
jgi:hypothetical protein